MEKQTSNVMMAKVITFVAFGVLLALGAFFLIGLVERDLLLGKETYGIARVIDEIKLITGDAGAYFKMIAETIKANLEVISKDGVGIALFCKMILELIFPLVSIFYFFMIVLHLALSWIPLVRVEELGWNKVCKRMSKKLKKVVGWMLAFMIYTFTLYGKPQVKLTAIGNVALWLVAVYAVARILIDGIGKQESIVYTVLSAVWAAVIAVFLVIVLRHFLLIEGSLVYSLLGYLEGVMTTKNPDLRTVYVLFTCYVLCFYISMQISAKTMEKQMVRRSDGLKASLIFLFIFLIIMAVLHFFALKKAYGSLSFSDWMDAEESKIVIRSVIYGLIGLALAIVTPFLNKMKKPQTIEEETSVQ